MSMISADWYSNHSEFPPQLAHTGTTLYVSHLGVLAVHCIIDYYFHA